MCQRCSAHAVREDRKASPPSDCAVQCVRPSIDLWWRACKVMGRLVDEVGRAGEPHSGALFSARMRLSVSGMLSGSTGPQTPNFMPSQGFASCSSSSRALSLIPSMISAALVRGANVGATPYFASVLSTAGSVRAQDRCVSRVACERTCVRAFCVSGAEQSVR